MPMLRKLASFKSIKSDFLLFTIPVLVIGFFLSGWISIQVVQKALEKDTLQAMSRKVDEAIHEIESIDESARRDMLLAMENPHFYEYFIPPKPLPDLAGDDSGRSEILAHQREKRKWLASMSAVLQKRYHILEACLIDKDGHEHLRVVRGINQPEEDSTTQHNTATFKTIDIKEQTGQVATDQTGRLPIRSSKGSQYLMVVHIRDPNIIMVIPLKNRNQTNLMTAYKELYTKIKNKGFNP